MAATTTAFETEVLAGALVYPAAPVNLVSNPSLESGILGYTAAPNGSQASVARIAAGGSGSSGAFMLRATALLNGQFGALYKENSNFVVPGRSYSVSQRVLACSVPGRTWRLQCDWLDNLLTIIGGAGNSNFVAGPGDRAMLTNVAPAGAARLNVTLISDAGALAGETVDLDCLMTVIDTYTGGYFDGDSPGYEWVGIAGASSSQPHGQTAYTFTATQRGLMAGAAYKLRQAYLAGITDPAAHTLAKNHPKQLKALTDNGKLASFDAITAP